MQKDGDVFAESKKIKPVCHYLHENENKRFSIRDEVHRKDRKETPFNPYKAVTINSLCTGGVNFETLVLCVINLKVFLTTSTEINDREFKKN